MSPESSKLGGLLVFLRFYWDPPGGVMSDTRTQDTKTESISVQNENKEVMRNRRRSKEATL